MANISWHDVHVSVSNRRKFSQIHAWASLFNLHNSTSAHTFHIYCHYIMYMCTQHKKLCCMLGWVSWWWLVVQFCVVQFLRIVNYIYCCDLMHSWKTFLLLNNIFYWTIWVIVIDAGRHHCHTSHQCLGAGGRHWHSVCIFDTKHLSNNQSSLSAMYSTIDRRWVGVKMGGVASSRTFNMTTYHTINNHLYNNLIINNHLNINNHVNNIKQTWQYQSIT